MLFVAVSQSGASPDLVETLARAKAGGATTLAITNMSESPLARAVDYHLDVLAGPEQAVAATKTYVAQLLTLLLLIDALAGHEQTEVARLPELAQDHLASAPAVERLAARYRFADQLITTARGYDYPTALEAALKLMETTYIVAHAFSGADLLHGPMAMIDRGFPGHRHRVKRSWRAGAAADPGAPARAGCRHASGRSASRRARHRRHERGFN